MARNPPADVSRRAWSRAEDLARSHRDKDGLQTRVYHLVRAIFSGHYSLYSKLAKWRRGDNLELLLWDRIFFTLFFLSVGLTFGLFISTFIFFSVSLSFCLSLSVFLFRFLVSFLLLSLFDLTSLFFTSVHIFPMFLNQYLSTTLYLIKYLIHSVFLVLITHSTRTHFLSFL